MSTPTYVDSKSITQADGAQSFRVPVLLPDDPYVAVRRAQLVDTESGPKEAPSEIEELQSLDSRVPLMGEEFETVKPSGTRTNSSHSYASSKSTTPLSPDHLFTHVSPTPTRTRALFHCRTTRMTVHIHPPMSPGYSATVTEVMALSDSAFRKRYRSSYETSSPSPSLTLPIRKRYRGNSELILDTNSEGDELGDKEDEKDESLNADDERKRDRERERERERERGDEAIPEGQQQALLVVETAASEPLGLGNGALRRHELAVQEDQPTLVTWIDLMDDRVYIDILAYTPPVVPVQIPPSPEWSLEHKQERTVMTFEALWRPVLALEAWAGHVDTRLADMLWARSLFIISHHFAMSTQQDIYAAGSESPPPMLNKENYVPWSSRLLRYAKSRPNGKLIHNSIINGPYVRRMIPEPGDTNQEVLVNETFHVQTDDELTEKELKKIEADDQAIRTILLGLPEDIYAAVDSCETAQEIWLRVKQMMKGSDIEIQEKKANNLKFLNNLQPEWSRHVTIVYQTRDLHTVDYTQLYDFLKYNQKEVDELKAQRLAKIQDPLTLMANSNNPYVFVAPHQDQPSFNQNYMQQPMPNPEDIKDLTTTMNMALALMAKAFKINYSTPTNNNQRILSNPRNRQIAQPCMNMGQDRQMQMVRGVSHFARNCMVRPMRRDATYLQTQLLIAQKEEARVQLQAEEFDLMAAAADLDDIEEVNANCILMANLQQASTSVTQTDKAPVYDLDGSAEKFMGTVRFGNDHLAAILGFSDLQWGNILITRVYFVKGLGHNLFSVGQFCYSNLEEMAFASLICLMARVSSTKSWLWHQHLSHLNFDTINDLAKNDLISGILKFKYHKEYLCPSCEQGKSKRAPYLPKPVPNSRQRLHLLHMDLCGPIRIASINGKLYVLVIMDDYSRYTWVYFLRSKDEAPEVIKTFLTRITVLLQNQTLVEAARTMLIFSRAPLFLWAEAIATACFTQNRSIIHRCFNKTPYELINDRKPDISFLHVFRALCYPKNDREDIGKLGAKGDIAFFIGYYADSCAYRIYNRRTKKIMETINVSFDELSAMAFEQRSELDLLFEAMYDYYIGGQPSATARTVLAAQEPQVRQTSTTSTSIADTAPTPTNSSSLATNFPNTSQDVDELNSQHQHVYVDDIIFGSTHPSTRLSQPRSTSRRLKGSFVIFGEPLIRAFTKDSGFELTGFSDADYTGCKDTFKSTFSGAQFLGKKLVSWSSKKQDCTALSTAEAEYVSLSACCAQVLWMRTQLTDYGFHFNNITIYCDSKSAIAISCNPVQHSRTTHRCSLPFHKGTRRKGYG
nr:integrase, catalytic region, zinc finger, CCHC-type, peptidase aspartic, catalytic [Tanacetum cinerariifolium]